MEKLNESAHVTSFRYYLGHIWCSEDTSFLSSPFCMTWTILLMGMADWGLGHVKIMTIIYIWPEWIMFLNTGSRQFCGLSRREKHLHFIDGKSKIQQLREASVGSEWINGKAGVFSFTPQCPFLCSFQLLLSSVWLQFVWTVNQFPKVLESVKGLNNKGSPHRCYPHHA